MVGFRAAVPNPARRGHGQLDSKRWVTALPDLSKLSRAEKGRVDPGPDRAVGGGAGDD